MMGILKKERIEIFLVISSKCELANSEMGGIENNCLINCVYDNESRP